MTLMTRRTTDNTPSDRLSVAPALMWHELVALTLGLVSIVAVVALAAGAFSAWPVLVFSALLVPAVIFVLGLNWPSLAPKPYAPTLGLMGIAVAAALVAGASSTWPVLVFSALLVPAVIFVLGLNWPSLVPKPYLAMSLIVSGGVILRLEHWPNLAGGQDQGLYTNMAAAITRSGSVNFVDGFRTVLPHNLQIIYDQAKVLSLSLVDPVQSLFQIEFYPLHPLWMAMTERLVGPYGQHLSLVLFALFGMMGGYFLALEIDGRPVVARLFTALLAVNPALVFFTKFPVGEVVASAFAVNGFLFFVRSVRNDVPRHRTFSLLLTCLCFAGLSFTRWQVFLYLPFLAILTLSCFIPAWARESRIRLGTTIVAILGTFALSLGFYRWQQPKLFDAMWDSIVGSAPDPISFVAVGGVAILLVIWLRWRIANDDGVTTGRIADLGTRALRFAPWLVVGALALSALTVAELHRTGLMTPWGYPVPVGSDPFLIRFHVLYRLLLFVSPVGMLLIAASPFLLRRRNTLTALLCGFLALLWIVTLTQPFVPYLYYYGRYLVVDTLPAALLLVAVVATDIAYAISKWVSRILIATVILWATIFSIVQMGQVEGEPTGTFDEFASHIDDRDIAVLSILDQRLVVPLRVTHEKSVIVLDIAASSRLTFEELRNLAINRGGRLILVAPAGYGIVGLDPFASVNADDCYLSNTDHFRGGEHSGGPFAVQRLLLPASWSCNANWYDIFDVTESSLLAPLVEAAATAGFFDRLGASATLLVPGIDQYALKGFGDTVLEGDITLTVELPEDATACAENRLCTSDGQPIYVFRSLDYPEGPGVLLAPAAANLGYPENPLIVMNDVILFGPENATPFCDMGLASAGSIASEASTWIMRTCSGAPALASTYAHWLTMGCTGELRGWYICPK